MTRFRLTAALLMLLAALPARAQFPTFGTSLALGEDELFVGQPLSLTDPGTVYVYRRTADGWQEAGTLHGDDAAFADGFGMSLALDGGRLAVGAFVQSPFPGAPSSAAYVFEREADGAWRRVARLTPGDDPAPAFGATVALRGDVLLVGAQAAGPGRVYAFRRADDGTWAAAGTLTPADGADGDRFGAALAFDGTDALVGAPGHEGGRVYVFRRSDDGTWARAATLAGDGGAFGATLALAGPHLAVGAPADGDGGAVHRFRRADDGTWARAGRLAGAAPGTGFAGALALAGDVLWAAAPGNPTTPGTATVAAGPETARLQPPDARPADLFGTALAAHGNRVAASAPGADYGAGRVLLFEPGADGWRPTATLIKAEAARASVTGGAQPCTGGASAGFDCGNVDLLAFLSLADLGAERGVIANDLWGWTDPETDREYALIGRSDGIAFVDLTSPENPVYLGVLPHPPGTPGSLWRDIKVYRNHAFIVADASGPHGMQVFDLTRLRAVEAPPVTFDETAHYDGIHSAHNLVINEETGYAYAVAASMGGETCGGGLHMIDIRDPGHPTFAGCFAHAGTGNNGTGQTHDAQCVRYHGPDAAYHDHEICFGANETALSIADVTDKENPVALARATYPNIAYAHQGWLTEDHRYFYLDDEGDEASGQVAGTRTLIWDVADLDDPQLVSEYVAPRPAADHNLYVKGHLMYQANYASGLRILDISDPEHPVEVGYFDTVPGDGDPPVFTGAWSVYPYFKSGVLIVSSIKEGLFILKKRDVDL